MFQFFRKKGPVSDSLPEFKNSFSTLQRAAIVITLTMVAKADNHLNQVEEKFIDGILKTLDFEIYNPAFFEMDAKGLPFIYSVLNTLLGNQKEWLTIKVYGMAICDGNINQKEINAILTIIENYGISQNKFAQIIDSDNKSCL